MFKGFKVQRPSVMVLGLMMASQIMATSVLANDEDVLKSEPINIEGYVKDQPNVTDSELESINNELSKQKNAIHLNKEKTKKYKSLQKTTEKLAEETENYLDEKQESEKVIDEYNKKIECLLEKKNTKECQRISRNKVEDSVSSQASSVQASEVKTESAAASALGVAELKALVNTGMTVMDVNNSQLQTDMSVGIQGEANISSKFSVGVGFNYSDLENTDFCIVGNECFGVWSGYYSPFNNQIGRKQEYKRYSLNAYSKFFPFANERFRPYLGAGLNYNRSNLKYTSNNQNAFYNTSYLNANEEVEMNSFGGELMLGTEIRLTKMIGINLEAKYSKAFNVNLNNNNPFSQYIPGQKRLFSLADAMENADMISLFAGLLITF